MRHYGYAREEFLAMAITEIRPQEDVDQLLASIEQEGPGSPIPRTWQHRLKDGTPNDVEITAGRVEWEGRDAALILAHDVSDRRRMEQRLIEAERLEAVGRPAGGVAHDFNNLLTVIHGYALLLAERSQGEYQRELDEIVHASEQATALTRQLLAFSRRQVLQPDVLDLNEIVGRMQAMIQRIIGDDVSVGVRFARALAPVEADRSQIERVILNLAANARDAMRDGGRLTIETANAELDEGYVASHGTGQGVNGHETNGYRVVVADGPADAERICATGGNGFDLVLSDVVMPGMDGGALADKLVELCPGARVLFMSGYSDEAVHQHGVIRPDSAFVEKPFTARTLTLKVREVLDAR